jgi:tetratricopeptide (TPR) repeat protein
MTGRRDVQLPKRSELKAFVALSVICFLFVVAPLLLLQAQSQELKLAPLRRLAPPLTADKLLILAKLRKRDFAGLDSEFERYQGASKRHPAAELDEKLAYDSFAADDPLVGDLIEEWIRQKPNSYAAHMAMGNYFSWRGWHTRGPAPASETASNQFERMRKYFDQSALETRTALKINPKLSIAYAVLLGEARGDANWALLKDLKSDALRELPASFIIREQVMESLYPRWGGNHETMNDFAQKSQAQVKENPCMHWLLGFADSDEGETLGIHGEFVESIAAVTRAIQKGGDYSGFYFIRGESYGQAGSYEQAFEDFDRADELDPQDPELLIRRAYVLAKLRRPREVLADLKLVAIFESRNDLSTQLHDWAVSASKETH